MEKKKEKTDEQRLIEYINGLHSRILKLEAYKISQDVKIKDVDKKLTRFINIVEGLRAEYVKLKSSLINLKEKVGNLSLANRFSKDKSGNLNAQSRFKNK